MHLLLTDRLACPRCGPAFGLILLADRVDDRRVLEGVLGCSNCRERYAVHRGFADLRPPPRQEMPELRAVPTEVDPEETVKLAALVGAMEGGGFVLLAGAAVIHLDALAGLLDEVEIVGIGAELRAAPERSGISRVASGESFPFYSGMFRGVALAGREVPDLLDEAIRVVARLGRLVLLDGADDDMVGRIEEAGLVLLAREGGTVVAGKR